MYGATTLLHRNTPVRLMSSTCFQSASVYSTTVVFGPVMPALHTSASIRPAAPCASFAAAASWSSRVTSTTAVRVLPPSCCLACASDFSSRSHKVSVAPEAIMRCAIAKPMPAAPPVMIAWRLRRSSWFI